MSAASAGRVYMSSGRLYMYSLSGKLGKLLSEHPEEEWRAIEALTSSTLLHYAALGENEATTARLVRLGWDVNALSLTGHRPIHLAANYGNSRVLDVLCRAGADVDGAMEVAQEEREDECAAVLMRHNVRLRPEYPVSSDMMGLAFGIWRCRKAVIALLRVKRAGNLWQWDKFLLKEVAYAVWSTRMEEEWQ